ncbi:MAG: hypothetical protein L0Z54_03705 [Thermoplasmata archaeon]|nr:hypothetical protein [Thermoplasmata archaeon]
MAHPAAGGGDLVSADGSMLVIEALARAGADAFVGYPITPTNLIFSHANARFPLFRSSTDEISAAQTMSGLSAAGKLPVTGTSFPGFALMLETVNMAFMMELPMVIVLGQRMGPSTGSATTGAQGDLLLLRGAISGGYALPVLCPSNPEDCWTLAAEAAKVAVSLRTPVVLLTSKEMLMTRWTVDLSALPEVRRVEWPAYDGDGPYVPYRAGEGLVPPFLPTCDGSHRTRFNASTHDETGLIRKASPGAIANTERLWRKVRERAGEFAFLDLDARDGASTLIVSYGMTAGAARVAAARLGKAGRPTSLLVLKTLLPLPQEALDAISRYDRVVVAEENLTGLLREMLHGTVGREGVTGVNAIGRMVSPDDIIKEVRR